MHVKIYKKIVFRFVEINPKFYKKLKMAEQRGARLSVETKRRILAIRKEERSLGKIRSVLCLRHGVKVSRQGIYMFLKKWDRDQTLVRKTRVPGIGQTKLKEIHKDLIQMWQMENDELTCGEMREKLKDSVGLDVSPALISKVRKDLGWQAKTGNRTCQLISRKNVRERLQWCLKAVEDKEDFKNVIFTDETTVEMCSAGRLHFFQKSSEIQKKTSRRSRPKHAYKVHVWGGISYEGRTDICMFTGTMDSVIYQGIIEKNLIPFAEKKFPNGFRIYQDNDSKHVSKSTKEWMQQKNLLDKIMKTPASSPDINPIENVWAAMKLYLTKTVKPKKKEELVAGIRDFWNGLSADGCQKFIDHIHKVIPAVVLNSGEQSGY